MHLGGRALSLLIALVASAGQVVSKANCAKVTCSASDLVAVTTARPWGVNNPIWNLYAYGSLRSVLPATVDSVFYVVVLVGDDVVSTTA